MGEIPSFPPFGDSFPADNSLDEDVCPNCNESLFDHTNNQIIQCTKSVVSGGK